MSETPARYESGAAYRRPGRPGVTYDQFDAAALEILKKGERPSVERIMDLVGGSHSTLGPMMDVWYKQLATRIELRSAAFSNLPGSLSDLAHAFFTCALDEAHRIASDRVGTLRVANDMRMDDLDARASAIRRVEEALNARIDQRDADVEELRTALREEKKLTRRIITHNELLESELRDLERRLAAAKAALVKSSRSKGSASPKKRKRMVKSVAPKRSRPPLRKVAALKRGSRP